MLTHISIILSLQHKYSQNPIMLFKILRHCLSIEMKLVAQAENLGGTLMNIANDRFNIMIGDSVTEITQQLEILRRKTYESGEDLRLMEQEQEGFAITYHECTKLKVQMQHAQTHPQNQHNLNNLDSAKKDIKR